MTGNVDSMTLPNGHASNRNARAIIRRRSENEFADWARSAAPNPDPGRELRQRAHRLMRAERLRRRQAERQMIQRQTMLDAHLLAGQLDPSDG